MTSSSPKHQQSSSPKHHQSPRPSSSAGALGCMQESVTGLMHEPRPTYIGRLIVGMRDNLRKLGASASNAQLEHWAISIHGSMSISSRNYHSVKHVFDLADGWDDPIGVISAYFHDCIYYHVDGGLSPGQASILKNVMITTPDHKIMLQSADDDELLQMCFCIFGFDSDKDMSTTTGLNEFLSALIAVRELESVLSKGKLAQIACCIEGTIPFRPVVDGQTPLERLYDRMVLANTKCELHLSDEDLVQTIQRAALLSNRDLGNFGSTDAAYFLDNTWSLLPELNKSLRHHYCYTVTEFQEAVVKMNGFFSFLQPEVIFQSFRGVPSKEDIDALELQASRNLEIGRTYVASKVLALSLLAAFATLTGGDAPMSLFMGDLPSRQHVSRRLEDYLDPPPPCSDIHPNVYNILLKGRKSETSFDIRQSPLAAYLYGCMGHGKIMKAVSLLKLYPMTPNVARNLIHTLPRDAVLRVGQNMAKVALSRADLIMKIVFELMDDDNGDDDEENENKDMNNGGEEERKTTTTEQDDPGTESS